MKQMEYINLRSLRHSCFAPREDEISILRLRERNEMERGDLSVSSAF